MTEFDQYGPFPEAKRGRVLEYNPAFHQLDLVKNGGNPQVELITISDNPIVAQFDLDPVLSFTAARLFGRGDDTGIFPFSDVRAISDTLESTRFDSLRIRLYNKNLLKELIFELLESDAKHFEPHLPDRKPEQAIFSPVMKRFWDVFHKKNNPFPGAARMSRFANANKETIQDADLKREFAFRAFLAGALGDLTDKAFESLVSDLIWCRTAQYRQYDEAKKRGTNQFAIKSPMGDVVQVNLKEAGIAQFSHEYVNYDATDITINLPGNHNITSYGSLLPKPPFRFRTVKTIGLEGVIGEIPKVIANGMPINFRSNGERLIIDNGEGTADMTILVPRNMDLSKPRQRSINFASPHKGDLMIENLTEPESALVISAPHIQGSLKIVNVSTPVDYKTVGGELIERAR